MPYSNSPSYLAFSSVNNLLAATSTTWAPNTPATIDEQLRISAPKINANFNTIGDGFGADHNALGSTTDIGQHLFSTYINQASTPTADPANARLFAALVSAVPEIFIQYPTAVAAAPFQLTSISVPTSYSPGAGKNVTEFSFKLNTQTIKIGTVSVSGAGGAQITFNTPFISVISLFACMPAGTALPQNYNVTNVTVSSFNLNNAAQGAYCYIAIGQ